MPNTMKAAVLTAYGQPLAIRSVPIPEPAAGEVLVKLEACGVCHTDVHFWRGEHELPKPPPQVLGHEGIGRIVKLGPGAGRFALGERVGIGFVYDTCGYCRECLSAHETNCRDVTCTGVHVSGCFAEYVCLRERWATSIPDGLDSIAAAPLLCGGVAAYSAVRKAALEPGELAVVFGLGGLGLYGVQAAKLTGARVAAVDIDDSKLAAAGKLGADHLLRADRGPEDEIQRLGGADACLNFAPVAATWQQMLKACGPRGRIVLVALPTQELSFHASAVIERGLTVRGSADGNRQELRQLMKLAAAGHIRSQVTAVRFDQVNDALQRLQDGKVTGRLVLDLRG
jgi:propanol-preferring alcohol dehydrogenase